MADNDDLSTTAISGATTSTSSNQQQQQRQNNNGSNVQDEEEERWTCEACGCRTNTEIEDPNSCGVCGTHRIIGKSLIHL